MNARNDELDAKLCWLAKPHAAIELSE